MELTTKKNGVYSPALIYVPILVKLIRFAHISQFIYNAERSNKSVLKLYFTSTLLTLAPLGPIFPTGPGKP